MSSIKDVQVFESLDNSKTYLILINPHEIPHLVLVDKGNYYALTFKESVIGRDFTSYLEALKRKKKKVLFLELESTEQDPAIPFAKHQEAGEVTCFAPIQETVLSGSKANFIFELVPELYDASLISQAFHLNMEDDLTELGDFKMSRYSLDDIYAYIERLKLSDAERRKGLSQNA